jgi:hypothetical protein
MKEGCLRDPPKFQHVIDESITPVLVLCQHLGAVLLSAQEEFAIRITQLAYVAVFLSYDIRITRG